MFIVKTKEAYKVECILYIKNPLYKKKQNKYKVETDDSCGKVHMGYNSLNCRSSTCQKCPENIVTLLMSIRSTSSSPPPSTPRMAHDSPPNQPELT
jgi:hypothetical protein